MASKRKKVIIDPVRKALQKINLVNKYEKSMTDSRRMRNRRLMDMASFFPDMGEDELKIFIKKNVRYVLLVIHLRVKFLEMFQENTDYKRIQILIKESKKIIIKFLKIRIRSLFSVYMIC